MKRLRTNQGGSVASFIIIGIIIFFSLVGAIYFVNKRSEQARKDQEVASEKKDTTDKEKTETDSKVDSKTNTDKVNTPADTDKEEVSDLPATGPEQSVNEIVGVFALSTSSMAFLSSRKKLSRSL